MENKNLEGDSKVASKKANNKFKRKVILIISVIVILAGLIFEIPDIRFMFTHVDTDDAFVEGSSAIVPVAPQVKGQVLKVFVHDNQYVKAGDPLFEIDSSDYYQNVNKADAEYEANMNELKQITLSILMQKQMLLKAGYELKADSAMNKLNQENAQRYAELWKNNAVSKLSYDEMQTKYEVSSAKVKADEANISQIETSIKNLKEQLKTKTIVTKALKAGYELARINLSRTTVYAPCDGYVTKKNVNPGAYVMPGIPYLSIVNLGKVWIVANFKETDIHKIKIGAPVIIKVDAYPGKTFQGHVASFQSGSGSAFSLLPPENATGNFIKVVQRVPVKITLDKTSYPDTPLYPGLSVIPYVLIEH
jgi:membrane fusion protein (multidrug efflux system)